MRMSVSPQDSEPIRLSNEDDAVDSPSVSRAGRKNSNQVLKFDGIFLPPVSYQRLRFSFVFIVSVTTSFQGSASSPSNDSVDQSDGEEKIKEKFSLNSEKVQLTSGKRIYCLKGKVQC